MIGDFVSSLLYSHSDVKFNFKFVLNLTWERSEVSFSRAHSVATLLGRPYT